MSVKLTDVSSVPAVLAEMTTEEKIALVSGGGTYATAAIPRLGIPSALLIDAGGGVNLRQYISQVISWGLIPGVDSSWGNSAKYTFMMDRTEQRELLDEEENRVLDAFLHYIKENFLATGEMPGCFPCNSLLASTWDEEAVYAAAQAVGREASAYGVDMLLGTTGINIQRDPRGGRGFEYYSEDPYLISRLAPLYPKGVQEAGVCADVKHYALNSQETNRRTINEIASERAIREIYLPGFKACVQKGGVKNIMSSYNHVNGVPVSQNRWLLTDILRKEWGFEGFVVSDWGGVYDHPAALKAGNDLRMHKRPDSDRTLEAALENGTMTMEELDLACERILKVLVQMPCVAGRKYKTVDNEAARKAAYNAAAGGIVLLKNRDALPLKKEEGAAFFGERSKQLLDSGIGSGRVHTNKTSSLLQRAKAIAGEAHVTFETVTAQTRTVVVTVSANGQEGGDRADISLDEIQKAQLRQAIAAAKGVNARVVVVLNVAGPLEMEEFLEDIDAMLLCYFPGMEGGNALGDILYGIVNPSGKLAQTFPKHLRDVPSYGNFPGEYDQVIYGEGIYVGYRGYDLRGVEPRFPFGHGLSYTTFALSRPRVDKEAFFYEKDGSVSVLVDVKNTGAVAGATVVQLYLHDPVSTQPKPVYQLKGFQKVFLEPGEEKTVELVMTREDFESYDEKLGWTVEPGKYVAYLGFSSRDLRCSADIAVKGKNAYGYSLSEKFFRLVKDPRAMELLYKEIPDGAFTPRMVEQFLAYVSYITVTGTYLKTRVLPNITSLDEAGKEALMARIDALLKEIDVTDLGADQYMENEVY